MMIMNFLFFALLSEHDIVILSGAGRCQCVEKKRKRDPTGSRPLATKFVSPSSLIEDLPVRGLTSALLLWSLGQSESED